jgi:hypothetical protein
MKLGIINENISDAVRSILKIPRELRDTAVSVADSIDMYKIQHFLEQSDLKSAVRAIIQVDSDEAAIDFLSKYLNIDKSEALILFQQQLS